MRGVVVVEPYEKLAGGEQLGLQRAYDAVCMDVLTAVDGSTLEFTIATPADRSGPDPTMLLERLGATDSSEAHWTYTQDQPLIGQRTQQGHEEQVIILARSPLLRRTHIDSALMRLRRHDVVITPASSGEIILLACGTDVSIPPNLTLEDVERAIQMLIDQRLSIDQLDPLPTIHSKVGWEGIQSIIRGHAALERPIAPYTKAALDTVSSDQ